VRRACPVTLKFATESKRHRINLLLEAYRGLESSRPCIAAQWPHKDHPAIFARALSLGCTYAAD
jgi:hypothetical protein